MYKWPMCKFLHIDVLFVCELCVLCDSVCVMFVLDKSASIYGNV